MKEKIKKFKELFFTKQFICFVAVGCINTFNGMLFPFLFSYLMNANIAYAISYIPSLAVSYFLNSIFTFSDREFSFIKYIKFCISYVPNFIIQNISFFLVYNLAGLPKILAILLASVIGIPLTFLIMKFFTFSKGNKKNGSNIQNDSKMS